MFRYRWAQPAVSRHRDGAPRPFPAAHGEHHGIRPVFPVSLRRADRPHHPVARDVENHGIGLDFHPGLFRHSDEPGGIFRPGELLLEIVEAEAIVDTLVEDPARFGVPFEHHDTGTARLLRGHGRGEPGRPAAHYQQRYMLFIHCLIHPFPYFRCLFTSGP